MTDDKAMRERAQHLLFGSTTSRVLSLDGIVDRLTAEFLAIRNEALKDNPETDATDWAHPAWWRGNEAGVEGVVHALNRVLDGDASGVFGGEELEKLHQRIIAIEKIGYQRGLEEAAKWHDEQRATVQRAYESSTDNPTHYYRSMEWHEEAADNLRALAKTEDKS